MRKVPVKRLTPGMVLARDVTIRSPHPDVLYKLRIDSGESLSDTQIKRLKKVGYPGVYIEDDATEDLSAFIVDEEVEQVQKEVFDAFEHFRNEFESGSSSNVNITRLRRAITQLIESLKNSPAMAAFTTLKSHDDYTAKHSLDVTKLSLRLALENESFVQHVLKTESGVKPSYIQKYLLEDLGMGAMLHDFGKESVDSDILTKPDKLNDEEWEEIMKHPFEGFDRLKSIEAELRAPIRIVSYHHHEKYDGTGYPQGLKAHKIHLYGRVSACADVYSALTSERSYRSAHSPSNALTIMKDMQDEGPHFDPDLWERFQELIFPYPIGQTVVLDDESEGVVCEVPEDQKTQPVVRVLYRNGERMQTPEEIQVNQETGPSIVDASPSKVRE